LTYKNFSSQQPNNLIKPYDILDGKQMVSPLGEHWVAMDGNSGKWFDAGNHADEYNNPVKYKAVFEFQNLNECTPPTDDVQDLTGRFCNSKVWDSTVDTLTTGQTVQCQNDINGVEYCPQSSAECGQSWDYENGYSVSGVGAVVDYTAKVGTSVPANVGFDLKVNGVSVNSFNIGYRHSGYAATSNGIVNSTIRAIQYYSESEAILTDTFYIAKRLFCADGSTPVNGMCTTYTCPSGYSDNGTNCKKNVNYTYYNYLCSADYTATNTGGNVQKTDPNTSTDNTSTLDDPLNSSTPPTNNCKKEKFTCLANESRPCAYVDGKHQCSPFPCLGNSDFRDLGTVEGANDKNNAGWNNDGECSGQIYIFNGKDHKCRVKDKFFGLLGGGCCDKDKVFFGLVACKANEKLLAKKRQNDLCHKVGTYCSREIILIGCVQTSERHCCFNSKLARIIHEQGRPQIGLSWGSGDSPNCRGFKPEEFQKLDMSKMNLSEAFEDIKISTANISTITTHIQNKYEIH